MRTRPHSKFIDKLKARRCAKCGGKLSTQVTRCRRCHATASRPKK